ncbi:Pro-interleukin-16 [Dissostichus eleginoides]|uniref:Pro-interleukin-16 n=1 Tax=Dissostichus eleginoides TaxID=100907 RepID=A0AAD9F7B6_DISEL|nr:Pro-interleukin-16 [Dissostichus eleginoides]
MDLSMLPTQVSDYDKQQTGACFTVRSASSPSYRLTRRPGVRKTRSFQEQEKESSEEVGERDWTLSGTNGTNQEEDGTVTACQARTGSRSTVRRQGEEQEPSDHKRTIKLNQNGTSDQTITEFGTDRGRNCNPASESRGRTDLRRQNMQSRSKSLDWRAGDTSPDRGKKADIYTQGSNEIRTVVECVGDRVISSIHAYISADTSSDQERRPASLMSETLDRVSRGNSLPVRIRSLSGSSTGARGTASSFGPKGGQSIMERIEKLYGSANFGKMEDSSDFSTPLTSHHRETTTDSLVSPQQRSYERASGGTFPRGMSSRENSSIGPVPSRKSFTWTQKDTKGSENSINTGTSRTRERLSGVQGQGPTQSRFSEEGGAKWGRGLEEMGTMSLDRARSRYSKTAQIRAAGAAEGITAPYPNTFPEEESSFSLKEEQENKSDNAAQDWTLLKSSSIDEDVFVSQDITIKTVEKKRFPERSTASAASVRNKINQFEALTQRGHDLVSAQVMMPRRAFSVPTQLSSDYDGVKKSGSAKAIGGLRYKWEELKEGREAGDEAEEKVAGAGKKPGSNRSLSEDEVGLRLGRKEREGTDSNETQEKGTDNNFADDFEKYSRLKSRLEIPLNGGYGRNFYIDETDFQKISSPEDSSQSPSLLLSKSSNTSAGVQKAHSLVTLPVSDDDMTPTNSPNNSPLLSPTTQPENINSIIGREKESTSVLAVSAKIPEQHSRLLPHPLASSSHSDLPGLISPENKAHPNGKKQFLDLEAWVAGLSPKFRVWNDDEEGYEDDDESTERDDDSNYDSDSGESSVTVTSSMSQSDHKSFCVSLSDLCNFAGVDYESENDCDEWQTSSRRTASLSSDMSALSCVSVMPSEELDRLLEDVRSVGDSTLQDYDDVQVVVLHKDMGVGLGFSLAGGVDQNKPVTVHKVFHSGVSAQEGSIREGDQVLSINGTALTGYAHWEALRVLRRAKAREMGVVVLRRGEVSTVQRKEGRQKIRDQHRLRQLLCVQLEKNSRDLGFSLEGGADSNLGNRPLTVQKIFQGGPVDKMYPGDEVEEIEGVSVVGMRRLEAWTLIRKLPPGPVDVVLRRPLKNLET